MKIKPQTGKTLTKHLFFFSVNWEKLLFFLSGEAQPVSGWSVREGRGDSELVHEIPWTTAALPKAPILKTKESKDLFQTRSVCKQVNLTAELKDGRQASWERGWGGRNNFRHM